MRKTAHPKNSKCDKHLEMGDAKGAHGDKSGSPRLEALTVAWSQEIGNEVDNTASQPVSQPVSRLGSEAILHSLT